ncbi:LOW QUALITY PROTEIN: NACHT and WD repeat domain-containing protein 2 [Fundulus heteroclitus]|uniref:LOW QUALITY PROTEIN: NACHT and WD repeat domain-containing protein 2 n=1 Tax=Fundulus heteroclitus TaxID=8078 RepID=UPI00165AA51A|nr:LOW QUALITY PROTEIN: NACHT and WD repeat domain-containing protein 2 [Fundulus heteroclitus]
MPSQGKGRHPTHPCRDSSCVKLYVCSNPEDSVIERRALREKVIPSFREHCRNWLSLDVRLIDPFESGDPNCWPDANTRQQLIEECRQNSAGPFLLALVGHQYGAAALPTQVEASEYQLLLQQSQQAGVCTRQLERAYRRDENVVPPSYRLMSSVKSSCSPPGEEKEDEENSMMHHQEDLRMVLQTAVSLCVQNRLMTAERAQMFYRSALDADLRFALESGSVEDILNRCVIYVHKVANADGERGKAQRNSGLQQELKAGISEQTVPTPSELLPQLCDSFLPALLTSRQILLYTTTTECDHRHGYTTARRRAYADSLCQQVFSDLMALTDSSSLPQLRGKAQVIDAPSREWAEQEQLCSILAQFYSITQPEEEKIRDYVKQKYQQRPLVLTGGPCTGKTVLVAHCAEQIKAWLADCDPVVISCFCSFSVNTSPKYLLSRLCHQIAFRYEERPLPKTDSCFCSDLDECSCNTNCGSASVLEPHNDCCRAERVCDGDSNFSNTPHSSTIEVDVSLSELEERLASLLAHLPSTKHPLVLILDGLDQLDNNVVAQIISGLPSPLPDAVKLVVTVSSNRAGLLQAIKLRYPRQGSLPRPGSDDREEETGYACIQLQSGDRKQCAKQLESLLRDSGRKVTSGQQALVNRALTSCCLPLYARLLHAHTSLWHSDSDVTESSLPDCVHSSISALLDHLEQKHGSSLVARTVSYVSLSRTGLCESELVDLLSSPRGDPAEREGTVSQVDVEWLLMDLKDFLVKRPVADSRVLSWVSRHFKLVVTKKYLGTHEARMKIHSEMVDYLSGGQAVFVNHTSETENEPDGRPFVFPAIEDVCWANTRKILELPHHLQQSGRLEEMERGLLMSSGFHRAMVQAGMLSDLVAMLEADEGSTKFLRERWLLASTLKSSACFLQTSPLQLPTVMETNLLPYLHVFPALEGYVRDIRRDRRKKGKGVGTLLCSSSSSVPPIRYLRPNPKSRANSVVETACTECGVVVEITDEGSAWIWRGSACDLVELSLSKEQRELRFAGVKSSGRFLLLSTRCNELLAWDVAGPERLIEVKQSLKTESAAGQTASTIEGFVSCQEKLCMWWKKESFVSVFDISSSTVTRFQCQSSVMCLIASSNSLSVYCGQEDGTVSILDLRTSSLLGTCVNSTRSAVMQVILCEEEQGIACVDKGGSIALWDIADKQQPPRLVKENSNKGKPFSVLNTDYSEAVSTLLVCQSHQVTLWDTCTWEMWDQFLASQGKAFTQAVLSLDGHLFLALLDHFLLVLVWRVSTGECVLSLETNTQPLTLLKTASDIVCVSQDGGLTVWDSEMINAAGTATKMRRGVKAVVVEQTGKCFYTADGSENVWRWSLDVGLPRFTFLHDGPVEKMQLSPNGSHLLSLSAGEIYIWQTKTGENIARIKGGGAADVLITPNGKFGVSISKRGLSRVWKLPHGGIVCSIHQYLSDAQVSAEGTFLVGLRYGDLLAASLWSGSISKRFSCIENSERVVAFRTLWDHPDFVVVLTASEAVYTWKLSEETVCQHFQLPLTFHCQPQDFHMSQDGSYALLSTDNNSVNILDLSRVRLCSLKAEGPVIKACLDKTGGYVVYVCNPSGRERSCACDLHSKLVLTVIRLSDRERVGSVRLHKTPLVLIVSEQQGVFVGFDDGSVGVFSVADAAPNEEEFVWDRENLKGELIKCPLDREPLRCLCLCKPNITWS